MGVFFPTQATSEKKPVNTQGYYDLMPSKTAMAGNNPAWLSVDDPSAQYNYYQQRAYVFVSTNGVTDASKEDGLPVSVGLQFDSTGGHDSGNVVSTSVRRIGDGEKNFEKGLNRVNFIYRIPVGSDNARAKLGRLRVKVGLLSNNPYTREQVDEKMGDIRIVSNVSEEPYASYRLPARAGTAMDIVDESLHRVSKMTISATTVSIGPSGAPAAGYIYGPSAGALVWSGEFVATKVINREIDSRYSNERFIPNFPQGHTEQNGYYRVSL